jgi:hypothetical protein
MSDLFNQPSEDKPVSNRGELGIENAKAFFTVLAGQVRAAASIDADGDGKIETGEWTSFGTGFLLAAMGSFGTARLAFPELGDVKGPEFGELVAHILGTDFLPDSAEEAEELIKLVLLTAQVNRLLLGGVVRLARKEPLDIDLFDLFRDSLSAG